MNKKNTTRKDCIGRPIPDWHGKELFITTDSEDLEIDINNFARKNKYCTALTHPSQASKKTSLISCHLKKGAKILNLNDPKDYQEAVKCAGDFDYENIDEETMKYLSYCGFAGVFYPTVAGVKIFDPAKNFDIKGITRVH
jgi:hypothetical protein